MLSRIYSLIYIELSGLMRMFWAKCIDTSMLQLSRAFVFGYLLPVVGAPREYMGIYFASAIFGAGMMEFSDTVSTFVSDAEGNNTGSFELLLPFSQVYIYLKAIGSHLCRAMVSSTLALFISLFLLWDFWRTQTISLFKVSVALFASHLFIGALAMLCAVIVTDLFDITALRRAVLHPLYFSGGHLFPWRAASASSPTIGAILLFNPIIYATESLRTALLGQAGFLPFWPAIGVLVLFSSMILFIGWNRFSVRLDLLRGYRGTHQ